MISGRPSTQTKPVISWCFVLELQRSCFLNCGGGQGPGPGQVSLMAAKRWVGSCDAAAFPEPWWVGGSAVQELGRDEIKTPHNLEDQQQLFLHLAQWLDERCWERENNLHFSAQSFG
jgi:hypothetical protein